MGPSRWIRRLRSTLPVATGALAGVCAVGLGYAVAYLAKAGEVSAQLSALPIDATPPAVWKGVVWVLFAMHTVPLVGSGTLSGRSTSHSVSASQFRDAWLLLVPVVLLVAGGSLVARRAGARTPRDGALAGTALAVGYVPAALLILLVSRWHARGTAFGQPVDVTVGPDPLFGAIAVLVYPVVLGAAGGALAARTG